MQQDELKQAAAQAAIPYIKPDMVLGIGTGSTVFHFIHALKNKTSLLRAVVSSSESTTIQIREQLGIEAVDANHVDTLDLYIDGADEITANKIMIKGGGAALTREKILTAMAQKVICIADMHKLVGKLGAFPLPIEVIPMARAYVARRLVALGGRPVYRQGVVTDNGNHILDVHQLDIVQPLTLEAQLNNIAGVVTVGLFAQRPADIALIAHTTGVQVL